MGAGPQQVSTATAVRRPEPVLDRERERRLTDRQRELLDHLGRMFDEGFADLTMAEIAARLNCSMRTLYALGSSREQLVLIVVDRNLWRIGRSAQRAIVPDMAPLEALSAYLRAAHEAVAEMTQAFAGDLEAVPAAQRLQDAHNDYLLTVTRQLLDLAVERGDIGPVDTAAAARVLGHLGRDFARPDVMPTLGTPPREAADTMVEVVLRGLRAGA